MHATELKLMFFMTNTSIALFNAQNGPEFCANERTNMKQSAPINAPNEPARVRTWLRVASHHTE